MLSIRLFGTMSLRQDETEVESLRLGKAAELFCFLLLRRDRPHARELLASMLWGDYTTEVSKKYLRQALWQLQTIFRDCIEGPSLLLADRDSVQVKVAEGVSMDVDLFENACAQSLRVHHSQLTEPQTQALRSAVDLYRGDLLEGWYQEWCLIERERLQNMYLMILEKMMHYSEERHQFALGFEMGDRILRLDRAHEGAHQSLMRMQYAAGDRAAAIRQYQRCESALHEELGVRPTRRTRELLDQICSDNVQELSAEANAKPAETANDSLHEVLPHLRRALRILSETQSRIEDAVQSIQQASPQKPSQISPPVYKLRVNQR